MPSGVEIIIVLVVAIIAIVWRLRLALNRLELTSNTCANCGYNLTALSRQRCPECGTTIEDSLRRVCRRTRTARSLLRMAIILMVGVVVWFGLGILQEFGPFYFNAEFRGQLSTDTGQGRAIQVVGRSTWWGSRDSVFPARTRYARIHRAGIEIFSKRSCASSTQKWLGFRKRRCGEPTGNRDAASGDGCGLCPRKQAVAC